MRRSCYIVAGGPSLRNFNFTQLSDKHTIVVNSSIFFVPNPDFFVTMDYTWFIKNGIEYGYSGTEKQKNYTKSSAKKYFVVGFWGDRCIRTEKGVIDKTFDLEYDLRLVDEVIFTTGHGGIGTTLETFKCGSDSGYSALQLAVLLGYNRIYLLGMDFTVEGTKKVKIPQKPSNLRISKGSIYVDRVSLSKPSHFYQKMNPGDLKEFSRKLEQYLRLYPKAAKQIKEKTDCEVFSCSPNSRLNEFFEYCPMEKALKDG